MRHSLVAHGFGKRLEEKNSPFLILLNPLVDRASVTWGDLADTAGDKALVFVALVAILPFMQPIPIPGVSSLLGIVIMLQGLSLATFRRSILPKGLRTKVIPQEKLEFFVRIGHRVYAKVGRAFQRRMPGLVHHRLTQILAGICLFLLAAFLALPLPIPASNFLPAIGIFCICLGLLEDDFLFVVLGISYTVLFGWLLSLGYHLIINEWLQ